MKKSLIALAVLAASGVASAQSTVTLYGLLDTYVGSAKSNGVSNTVVESGGIQTSRFGFKGSEDLGGGLKANFLLESGFNVDNGSLNGRPLFGRQSYVGFSGGFGEVKLGKMWTAYDDLVGSGISAFNANVFAPTANVFKSTGYSDTPGNSVYYSTPDFGGFTGAASYTFRENKTVTTGAGKIISVQAAYAGGPVFVGFAYQTEKATAAAATVKFMQLNGSYDLGVAKLLAAYGNVKNGSGVSGGAFAVLPKTTEFTIGADFPVTSAFTLSGGYARSRDEVGGGYYTRKGFGIAGLYALSKRTNAYVGLNSTKSTEPIVGKNSIVAVGVRHTF